MSNLEGEFAGPIARLLDAYAPEPQNEGDWHDVVRRAGVATTVKPFGRRARLLVLAVLLLALLSGPTYAIGRAVISSWLSGEPAPKSVVDNFGSYTPQLGFQPEPGKAVRVARDRGISLYATTNDRGTYCVATSTPDGGICIQPRNAAAPLIAGLMPRAGTTLIAGRVSVPGATGVTFTDPDGGTITRPLESSGFFLAALSSGDATDPIPLDPCKNGDWISTFRAFDAAGRQVATAQIALADARGENGAVCTWASGPHR